MAIRKSSISGTPFGGTSDRPSSPVKGQTFYNGDTGHFEIYTGTTWVVTNAPAPIPISVVATNQGSGRAFNNGQASVAFSDGTGGGLVTDYIVTPSPATSPATFTASSSPIIITGLQSSQQYTYTMQARNNFGTSLFSAASTGVTATTVPEAPTVVAIPAETITSALITITPGATGGSAITQYTIVSNPTTTTQTTSNTTYTFTGLTAGTNYTFTATATNANGTSLSSSASSSIFAGAKANGGTITTSVNYVMHSFTSSNTFSPLYNLANVEYLVVAGGGAGWSSDSRGGGGAGGYRSSVVGENSGGGASAESRVSFNSGTDYTITIGAGGIQGSGESFLSANNGSDSSISGSGLATITSIGGGSAAGWNDSGGWQGRSGGSGGGGFSSYTNGGSGGAGTAGQGYAGGGSTAVYNHGAGGGGGGAGSAGTNSTGGGNSPYVPQIGGNGGNGLSSAITGTSIVRASGGAGGGTGGSGLRGTGVTGANSGSGGSALSNGDSGVVILRYAI